MEDSQTGGIEKKVKLVTVKLTPPKFDSITVHQIIKENIKTLEEINAVGVTGTVEVKFKVEDDGSHTKFEVIKSLTPETDAEALRVIQLLPKEEPLAQQEDCAIVTGRSSTIPINFPYISPFEN